MLISWEVESPMGKAVWSSEYSQIIIIWLCGCVCVCVSHGELWGAEGGGGVEWWLGVTVCSVCATVEQVYSATV
jgi:hypothetical protein